jgi:RimJ/RimL family protein N-acetyltransferase
MKETYQCPDGRQALLTLFEGSLTVTAEDQDGKSIGRFHFDIIDGAGELVGVIDDTDEPVSLKMTEAELDPAWTGQGIAQRATQLARDETGLPALESP